MQKKKTCNYITKDQMVCTEINKRREGARTKRGKEEKDEVKSSKEIKEKKNWQKGYPTETKRVLE